jgi:hypothetical protein
MTRVILALAIALLARDAGADCSNTQPEGWDKCAPNPGCCDARTVPCPDGSWYTQYTVRTGCGTGSGSGGSGSGSQAKPPPIECEQMEKWLDAEKKILSAYEDNQLLRIGEQLGWSPDQYDEAISELIHGGLTWGGPALMQTNRRCIIELYEQGCRWLLGKGLPPDACQIARAHELVHVGQCSQFGKMKGYDPSKLSNYRDREVEALTKTINDIQQWIDDHC